MGSFYSNVIVIGSDEALVANVCRRPAFVASDAGHVVVFAEGDDDGMAPTEGALSSTLACTTLNVSVHDSDLLSYQVFERGELMASGVVPDPALVFGEMFSELGVESPTPDPDALVAALGRGDVDATRAALSDEFVFAEERREALLQALTLPTSTVGFGYRYLQADDTGYQGPTLTLLD